MNTELLHSYITEFQSEVQQSGFRRDLSDFSQSLPASQSNIVGLREIAASLKKHLDRIYSSDLPRSLKALLPGSYGPPFTDTPFDQHLTQLCDDSDVELAQFFARLQKLINQLSSAVDRDNSQIEEIADFINPYRTTEPEANDGDTDATISLVFIESATIESLKNLSRTLTAWNKFLPLYHQLLNPEPPRDIRVVTVEAGSIDLVINLNVDVALDLVEAFKVGFTIFGAYLTYKKTIAPIVSAYYGNEKLLASEDEREKDLLENIGIGMRKKIAEQHERAVKTRNVTDKVAAEKKIETVASLFTSHIVKGNDVKLLALPPGSSSENEERGEAEKDELRQKSLEARRELRRIDPGAQQKLLELYGQITEDGDSKTSPSVKRSRKPTKKSGKGPTKQGSRK